jgi:16S rRNA (guanine(966)-N(2))-methyltransferase RsmD
VRIIGGEWRSRWLQFPASPGLRPTPDRVRETLFNWLGQDLTGQRCLDLFAGSGALGLEAASRGAQLAVLVERDPRVYRALEANVQALAAHTVELVRADALEFLAADTRVYDVVFLDPPYAVRGQGPVLDAVRTRLAPDARVYLESSEFVSPPVPWEVLRQARAGAVHCQLLRVAS